MDVQYIKMLPYKMCPKYAMMNEFEKISKDFFTMTQFTKMTYSNEQTEK